MAHVATPIGGSSVTSATSVTFTFSSSVAAGHTLIGTLNTTELTASPTFTVSDSKSNVYTVDAQVTASVTDVTVVFSANITTVLSTTDTLTIHISDGSHSRWAISVEEFDNILTSPRDQTATSTGSGTSMTSTATAVTTTANELVFGGFGMANSTAKTFTPETGYTNSTLQTTSAGSTDRSVCNEWLYISTTGAQTATATLNVSTTWAAVVVTYKSQATNNPPVARAGPNQSVVPFVTVQLDGSGSSDIDGSVTSYAWTQLSGPTVTLSSSSAQQPTFTAPGIDGGTSVSFSLVVTDNQGANSPSSTVTVTVSSATEFVAQAGSWQSTQVYDALNGSWQ